MLEIGIVETRTIIKAITEKYSIDFSDYALTSFKQRLEHCMDLHNIKHVDILINKLTEDKLFFDSLLSELEVPSTEMFRDPSLWRAFREDILPNLLHESGGVLRIWMPNSVSGDELFSLCILLQEMDALEMVKIYVSALSKKSLEVIQSGHLSGAKQAISSDNYIRANGKKELSLYYTNNNGELYRDLSLIKNAVFSLQNIYAEPTPQNIRLVLFRNKMIYYNQTLQTRVLHNIEQVMGTGSYLVIGTKETLNTGFSNNEFVLYSNSESIYKRKG